VSKQARLKAVKVLGDDGSGSYAGIVAGIEWIEADCAVGNLCIISMSLGGSSDSPTMKAALQRAAGRIFVSVAAGNNNGNACLSFPAAYTFVCTVGATDISDKRSVFSNYGTCVNIFAPGTDITSTWIGDTYRTISGTSMACPHVSGEAANLWTAEPNLKSNEICANLVARAQTGLITSVGTGSPNKLLYNQCTK